jgi:Fic family protein
VLSKTRNTLHKEEVFKCEAGEEVADESLRLDIQQIINYRRALLQAEEMLKEKRFGLNTLLGLHTILLDSVRGYNKGRGKFRTTQIWMGKNGTPIEQADFVPPSPMDLMNHLGNWEKYYHAEERDPLVQLAVIHAQFEIIHPFIDGNGRIGRMLIPLFLFERPVFRSSDLTSREDMPSTPMVMSMLRNLKQAGILKGVREGGRRPQVLALAQLINLCECNEVR